MSIKRQFALFLLIWGFGSPASSPGLGAEQRKVEKEGAREEGLSIDWTMSGPLVGPAQRREDPCYSVKDPSIVFFEGRWHLFCTIRSVKRSHQIEYLNFSDWSDANSAERHILTVTNGYFCAPQVFYFEPQRKWYLIYQALDTARKVALQPAFSTSPNLSDPQSWTPPVFLFSQHPDQVAGWIDFWVICDDARAFLFFTSNNGKMWRSETGLASFPFGWSQPKVVLEADIFEASHTYRVRQNGKYLTIIESVAADGRRYYKAYSAERLDGNWTPMADSLSHPFAGMANVQAPKELWAESISHGELLRAGFDQRLEVDADHLRSLFQGVLDRDRQGKKYGEIPWRLGLLESSVRLP